MCVFDSLNIHVDMNSLIAVAHGDGLAGTSDVSGDVRVLEREGGAETSEEASQGPRFRPGAALL